MVKEIVVGFILYKLIGKKRAEKVCRRLSKYANKASSVVLFIIAVFHGLRIALKVDLSVGGWEIPFLISFLIAVITSVLAFSLWKKDQ